MGGSRARPHLSSQHSYSNARAHACATSRKCPADVLIPFFCNSTRSRVTRASIHVEVFCFSLFLPCLCNITLADTYIKHDQSFKYRGQTYAEVIPPRVGEIHTALNSFFLIVFIWCHRVRGYLRPPAVQIICLRAEMMKIWEAASQLRIRQIRITLNTEACKAAPAE